MLMQKSGEQQNSNRRERRMNRRRAEILQVAARMFAELGYERTTFEMIADELGLSKPSLYYYITSKEDVLAQLLEEVIQGIEERVNAEISPLMRPDERLRRLVIAHISRICVYPQGRVLVLYDDHLLAERKTEILSMRERYQRLVQSIITEGAECGLFCISDPKMATLTLLGAMNWVAHWYSPRGSLSPRQIGEHYARILVGGLIHPFEGEGGPEC
ncbi:MAG: TetR family transcriptional regulator [Ktedonobacteraceae bacterium]|nr:TetR family transcriptional regulator [Ktedonobacteraceae bacterium]